MRVLILGAAGMIGRKLSERLRHEPSIAGQPVDSLVLVDVVEPRVPADAAMSVETAAADLASPGDVAQLFSNPDVIFHLAAVVSGEAEADFDKGYRVNLDGTRTLFEEIRRHHRSDAMTRVVFASSIAVFGPPFPDPIPDDFRTAPMTSYGTQKAMCELLLADYSRRGILDGIGLRLPTICIRPGAPNRAASGFFSNILREPLAGHEAVLPVPEDVRHWHASPRAAVQFLLHAAAIDLSPLGVRRSINMPGLCASVGEQIEALRRIAGNDAVKLIRREPDPTITAMVASWPRRIDAATAEELGFTAERSFDEIIRAHVEDELGGRI